MCEFNYQITAELGTLSEWSDKAKKVRMISCNGAEPKLDIRTWQDDRMLKGITLNHQEAVELLKILQGMGL